MFAGCATRNPASCKEKRESENNQKHRKKLIYWGGKGVSVDENFALDRVLLVSVGVCVSVARLFALVHETRGFKNVFIYLGYRGQRAGHAAGSERGPRNRFPSHGAHEAQLQLSKRLPECVPKFIKLYKVHKMYHMRCHDQFGDNDNWRK